MGDNEDYLDSLLKQAATIDNPDSALSRVKELTRLEKDTAELEEKDNETFSISDVPIIEDKSFEEESIQEESIQEELIQKELPIDDLNFEEAISDVSISEEQISDESVSEEQISDEPVADEQIFEETISEEQIFEETISEEPVLEESVSEESSSEDSIPEVLPDEALLSDETPEDEPVSNETPEDEPVSNETPADEPVSDASPADEADIDSLLNSDFAGEIDIEDVKSDDDSVSYSSYIENTPADEGGVMSADEIDKLINSMNNDTVEEIELGDIDPKEFSESDIDKMLNEASDVGATEIKEELEIDLADLEAFENEFGIYEKGAVEIDASTGDIDSSEEALDVDSLIDGQEGSEQDFMNLLNDAVSEDDNTDNQDSDEDVKDKKAKKEKKKKEKKSKKKDDSTSDADPEKPEKKKGKLAKFFDFMTAEDESQEDLIKEVDADGNSTEGASGENKDILEEVDKEEDGKGKKKKKKKDKKKGKGKDKEENKDDSGDESEEDGGEDKKKKKKPKKEKKERKPLELDIDTGKPLSKKNVILIFILCLSVMGAILLVVNIIPPLMNNKEAREAFYKEQYETTYHNFYGEKLKESDQILFESAEIILKMQHKLDAYNAYLNMGMKVEALDQLLQAVSNYDVWVAVAEAHNVRRQFDGVYSNVISALNSVYGLTLEEAKEVNSLPTDLEYSLKCYAIATGTEYIDPNGPMPSEFVPPTSAPELEDKLSEEGL